MDKPLIVKFKKRYDSGLPVSLQLEETFQRGPITVLFGPSGSGKTTLLRAVAGLLTPDAGEISFAGQTLFSSTQKKNLKPQQRNIGFLFQNYALFPHLTIEENVCFGLKNLTSFEREKRLKHLLDFFQLFGLEKRYPSQISGGQQQRVALARAIGPRPSLLLLDEPLSALDIPLRESLRKELRHMLCELQTPTLVVSHERIESRLLGDSVAILDGGQVRQHGESGVVFDQPATVNVARAIGFQVLETPISSKENSPYVKINVNGLDLLCAQYHGPAPEMRLCLRQDSVRLRSQSLSPLQTALDAQVESMSHEGEFVRLSLMGALPLSLLLTRQDFEEKSLRLGDILPLSLQAGPGCQIVPMSSPLSTERC